MLCAQSVGTWDFGSTGRWGVCAGTLDPSGLNPKTLNPKKRLGSELEVASLFIVGIQGCRFTASASSRSKIRLEPIAESDTKRIWDDFP